MSNNPELPGTSEPDDRDSPNSLDVGLQAAFMDQDELELPGTVIDTTRDVGMVIAGKYKLIELIGEGGMGTVWMAQQSEPVKRVVAIKLIKPGMDSRSVIARFNAERQALALMDHPNIAKVLDGGVTDQGRPYFAMELVKGTPITKFCDERRLNLRERLKLFVPVCQAIQHAHQKGIIHRDIKPSNVLIALFDDMAVPKVIDFGVAKATGADLADHSVHTGIGAVVGTPEYMSPEQASLNNLDIDTRSDVYSLGVVLYELLAGSPPFRRAELHDAGMLEMLRVIREVDPPLPSMRLSTAKTKASIAAVRNVEPDTLSRMLRSDLDWVVMRSLEKDRTRRYETVLGLSRDIQRFLAGEPVEAAPPSRTYRFRKWFRRNRRMAIGASLLLLALLGGISGTTWGMFVANRQTVVANQRTAAAVAAEQKAERSANAERIAREAETEARKDAVEQKLLAQKNEHAALESRADMEAFANFLTTDILAAARPEGLEGGLGIDTSVREALIEAENHLSDRFHQRPLAEATARKGIGETWNMIGELDRAEVNLRKALELFESRVGNADLGTIWTCQSLATTLSSQGKYDEALDLQRQAISGIQSRVPPEAVERCGARNGLAVILLQMGNPRSAYRILNEIKNQTENNLPEEDVLLLDISFNLARAERELGNIDRALELGVENLSLARVTFGSNDLKTGKFANQLANVYTIQRNHEKAIQLYEGVVDLYRAKRGANYPVTLEAERSLGVSLREVGLPDQSVRMLTDALAKMEAKLGAKDDMTLKTRCSLALSLLRNGQPEQAQLLIESVAEALRTSLDLETSGRIQCLSDMVQYHMALGQLDKALPIREELLDLRRTWDGPSHILTLGAMNNLATLYWRLKMLDKSIPLFHEVLDLMRKQIGENDPRTQQCKANLAINLNDNGQVKEAVAIWEALQRLPEVKTNLPGTTDLLIRAYLENGQFERALTLLLERETVLRHLAGVKLKSSAADSLPVAIVNVDIADNLRLQRRYTEAAVMFQTSIKSLTKNATDSLESGLAHSGYGATLIELAIEKKTDDANDFGDLMQKAESILLQSIAILEPMVKKNPQAQSSYITTVRHLNRLYTAWDKPDEAAKWKQ